jgi:hypothetical protein
VKLSLAALAFHGRKEVERRTDEIMPIANCLSAILLNADRPTPMGMHALGGYDDQSGTGTAAISRQRAARKSLILLVTSALANGGASA